MTETAPATTSANRSGTPDTDSFRNFMSSGWLERQTAVPESRAVSEYAAIRRSRLAEHFPGMNLVIPAGITKVRSNDTDYPYRAHSAFAYLSGWGSDTVPGSVLLIGATGESTLFFPPGAGRDSAEFYANSAIGEFWTGSRPSLDHVSAELKISTRAFAEFRSLPAETLILRGIDQEVDELLPAKHAEITLAQVVSEIRLIKDDYEIAELRAAITATKAGFDDVIADLGQIAEHPRGERLVEGTFGRRARAEGNTVGYDTIAASGAHACILHWTRNDGSVRAGDLLLIDAGVERESLYTADITRTFPVSGRFSSVQLRVYQAVLAAADAAFAIVRPGIKFRDIHNEAMRVIAKTCAEWGFTPKDSALAGEYHRRYMVHGTSHHLGLDVHDCAQARQEMYLDGIVQQGMVFTIEPGLYFQPDDLTVPEEYRGIGVRIEDNILVTATGAENLSVQIPRTADDVVAWLTKPSAPSTETY